MDAITNNANNNNNKCYDRVPDCLSNLSSAIPVLISASPLTTTSDSPSCTPAAQ